MLTSTATAHIAKPGRNSADECERKPRVVKMFSNQSEAELRDYNTGTWNISNGTNKRHSEWQQNLPFSLKHVLFPLLCYISLFSGWRRLWYSKVTTFVQSLSPLVSTIASSTQADGHSASISTGNSLMRPIWRTRNNWIKRDLHIKYIY